MRSYIIGESAKGSLLATGVSPAVASALIEYIEAHRPTGSFLQAVITNNLREALCRADDESSAALPSLVKWMYREAPGICHGSLMKYVAWTRVDKNDAP